jgi:hypothetical protein
MVISESDTFRASLTPDDRNTLSALVNKVATLSRGTVPSASDLATRIHTAGPALTLAESQALAAYVLASLPGGSASNPKIDSRQFAAVSKIMKTKHDTVKNTISNIH